MLKSAEKKMEDMGLKGEKQEFKEENMTDYVHFEKGGLHNL